MKIAIVGGGFSAISILAHFAFNKNMPAVTLIEKGNGLGTAFGAALPWHLLNVRAGHMGAQAHGPEGFFEWMLANQSEWRKIDSSFANLNPSAEDFVPRIIYARYLSDLYEEVKDYALKRQIPFNYVHDHAIDIKQCPDGKLRVVLQDGKHVEADKVVLASGIKTSKALPFAIDHWRYIPNIWNCNKEILAKHISQTHKLFNVGISIYA